MLQVINLSKIYKTKNGADVRALDGVTLQFPETGMVFLLGKSGSGKSTLLNVCGGLDSPSDGEIIVKGRSSRNFSQSDFDSYRNTFIGFIFQEYNILNEFSVEDNIALALELQGKPKDKAAINALLDEVDLTGFAKRKPNTLSGGQKQRIAIARALVKAPQIIMADEPTGALDSNTGKQVFETLKKLSKSKLVIVVSHDRDFAEQYGDRIIELQDGKVLSDVTKTQMEQQVLSENVGTTGDVLCIKRGAELSERDFATIKAFLKQADSDVIIAGNEKDVKTFKKVSRINDSGEKEVFCDTDHTKVESRSYTPEESRFIRSKLPARHAVKIGLSSLKNKPFRLVLTTLLCTVAFILFGLLSTMSFYDSEATFRQTLQDTQGLRMRIEKVYESEVTWFYNGKEESTYTTTYTTRFSDSEFKALQDEFGEDVFGGVPATVTLNTRDNSIPYWINRLTTFAYLPESNSLRQQINGSYPTKKDEILLSTYTAEALVNSKAYGADGTTLELTSSTDLIGKKLVIGGVTYKVTGLFNSGTIPEKYEILRSDSAQDTASRLLFNFTADMEDSLHLVAFVSAERLQTVADENKPYTEDNTYLRSITAAMKFKDGTVTLPEWANACYIAHSSFESDDSYFAIQAGKTAPAADEAILSRDLFYGMVDEYVMALTNNSTNQTDELNSLVELASQLRSGGAWKYDKTTGKDVLDEFSEDEINKKTSQLLTKLKAYGFTPTISLKLFNNQDQLTYGDLHEFRVIGISDLDTDEAPLICLNDAAEKTLWDEQKTTLEYYTEASTTYVSDPKAVYGLVFLPYDGSEEQTSHYWTMYQNESFEDDGSRVNLVGVMVENLHSIDDLIKSLSQVFLYVGLVLAVFAALLFSNFISVSITQKKREIGILRAVGARSTDVFKIFFSESFFIAFVCILLSTIGSLVACHFINAALSTGIGASLLVFGPLSFAVLVLIALLTAVVATFLPVYHAARKKPVDSIRAL